MLVKIAPFGERVVEVNVEEGTAVSKCLEIAGVSLNGRAIRVDGAEGQESTLVTREGAIIVLTNKSKAAKR